MRRLTLGDWPTSPGLTKRTSIELLVADGELAADDAAVKQIENSWPTMPSA